VQEFIGKQKRRVRLKSGIKKSQKIPGDKGLIYV
jgi:hypothetical protein